MNDRRDGRPDGNEDRVIYKALKAIHDDVHGLRELSDNIHKDVHGIRKQFLDAIGSIEQSQTRMLSLISNEFLKLGAKIDKLTPAPGGTVNTKALDEASDAARAAVTDAEKALSEGKPAT